MKLSILLFLIVSVSSCSSSNRLRTAEQDIKLPQTDAESILVFSTEKTVKEYTIIGKVIASADAGRNSYRPIFLLKEQAAKLGADAIIDLKLEFTQGYWAAGIIAKGTAIKFIEN